MEDWEKRVKGWERLNCYWGGRLLALNWFFQLTKKAYLTRGIYYFPKILEEGVLLPSFWKLVLLIGKIRLLISRLSWEAFAEELGGFLLNYHLKALKGFGTSNREKSFVQEIRANKGAWWKRF